MPIGLSALIQAGLPTVTFSSMPELVSEIAWEEEVGNSLIVREPAGVVAAITPWNYPLHQIANKVAPALAAGCTVVLKPSGVAPLNAFVLAEIMEEVGVPAGVFNLVTGSGRGRGRGDRLAPRDRHGLLHRAPRARAGACPSWRPRRRSRWRSSSAASRPNVILDDADLEEAVTDGVAKCFLNSGQTCSALTRMLVPRDKLEQAEKIAATIADEAFTPGDPFQDGSALGPLVSESQRETVRGYIEKGAGGGRPARGRRRRAARGPRQGLLRASHRLLRRDERHDHRAGGDLRPGARDHPVRGRGRRRPDRERQRLRPCRRRLVGRRGARQARGRAGSARARSRSTAAPSTRWLRSAATSSRATAASSAATASRSSSWPSRFSSRASTLV